MYVFQKRFAQRVEKYFELRTILIGKIAHFGNPGRTKCIFLPQFLLPFYSPGLQFFFRNHIYMHEINKT